MRVISLVAAGLLVASSVVAHANAPLAGEALGQMEAIIRFCGLLKPDADPARAAELKSVLAGMTLEQLAEVRKTPEYRRSLDAATAELQKADKKDAEELCRPSTPEKPRQ